MGIGFFAPLPLAMMLPFMAGQSMIMGESFGKGFQYGKRKISSMSNEQFNAMDANQLGKELLTDYQQIIPHLEQAVRASSDFQQMIIQELIKIIPNFIDQLLTPGGGEPEKGPTTFVKPGVPSFITGLIGPPPSTILEDPDIIAQTTSPPIPGLTAVEQYASRWLNPKIKVTNLSSTTFQEISYLLQQRANGNLFPQWKSLGSILLKEYNKKKLRHDTPEEAIAETTNQGSLVQQIASSIAALKKMLKIRGLITNTKRLDQFIRLAKAHNRLMQANRKYSFVVDTAKTLNAKPPRLIFKTKR